MYFCIKKLMNTIFQFMKRNYKIVVIILTLSVALWSYYPKSLLAVDPKTDKDKLLLELLTFVIERGHYSPAAIDDSFSKGVYKSYLNTLDPSKRFFLQSDIDEFAKYETQLDDQIKNKDLSFFNLTYDRLIKRMAESSTYYKAILEKPIDYTVNETIDTDYEKMAFASSIKDLKERWRKQIKLSTLSSLSDRLKIQENKIKGIKEEKSEDSLDVPVQPKKVKPEDDKIKTFAELEKETRESALKSMNEYFDLVKDIDREEWFSFFVNCIAERFDPHTTYFAPDDKDRFDTSISGKLEGIGARLQKKNDFTEITEVISGGPAWKGKELEAGDVVLKVAQADAQPVEVVGMKLDDVVKKIKGPKGTEVRLTVKKVDGTIKVITIVRDIVEIEETYAKSTIVEKNGLKFGIIYLPKFYIDFENRDGRDAGKDMANEVKKLKAAGVNGIAVDVRDDGGGSLKTVVDIAGLFITEGPIVQVKSAGKKQEVLYDRDNKIEWDGPLVVLVNGFSASASEILAAAIQDYKRGIIIGSKQTYGKGTVQNVVDLNNFVRTNSLGDLGALKTTTQKFYRINGGSTQLEGVSSDVAMPDRYMYLKMGERDIDNAMPWDKIEPAKFTEWDKHTQFEKALANSKLRMQQNNQLKLIEENAKWVEQRSNEYVYSLNIDDFRKKQSELEAISKKYKVLSKYNNQMRFNSLPDEVALLKNDEALREKRKRWHENLAKDVYIEEAISVLNDLQTENPKTAPMKKMPNGKSIKM